MFWSSLGMVGSYLFSLVVFIPPAISGEKSTLVKPVKTNLPAIQAPTLQVPLQKIDTNNRCRLDQATAAINMGIKEAKDIFITQFDPNSERWHPPSFIGLCENGRAVEGVEQRLTYAKYVWDEGTQQYRATVTVGNPNAQAEGETSFYPCKPHQAEPATEHPSFIELVAPENSYLVHWVEQTPGSGDYVPSVANKLSRNYSHRIYCQGGRDEGQGIVWESATPPPSQVSTDTLTSSNSQSLICGTYKEGYTLYGYLEGPAEVISNTVLIGPGSRRPRPDRLCDP